MVFGGSSGALLKAHCESGVKNFPKTSKCIVIRGLQVLDTFFEAARPGTGLSYRAVITGVNGEGVVLCLGFLEGKQERNHGSEHLQGTQ